MGCCLTKNKASSAGQNHHSSNGRECVPPSMEEETVKEVLSETPTPKPATSIANIEDEKTMASPKLELEKIVKKSPVCAVSEEISEVSEICSVSESVSTTTVTERREDDDSEVKQRVDRSPAKFPRNRSYSGDFTGKRDRVVGRSPARRSDPSPGRRNDGGVRSGLGREGSQTTTTKRRLGNNAHSRDSGENSGRRSRSPATRTDAGGASRCVLGRSSSNRNTLQSSDRTRTTHLEKNPKVEETDREGKWPPSNESLENPLVSLECFIFL